MLAHDIAGDEEKDVGGCVWRRQWTLDAGCCGGSGFATDAFQDTQITRPIKKL